ncbi:MAG: hypothetical protein ACYTG6_10340, partial [Planctomycetota bacterium]
MKEHPFLVIAKLTLMLLIGVLLVLIFVAQNETQSKVIRTADAVDEVKDEVADLRRMVRQGVAV